MIFLAVPVIVFLLDYFLKNYIEKNKIPGEEEKFLGDRVVITRMSNYGAAGSRFREHPRLVCVMQGIAMLAMGAVYIRLLMERGRTGLKLSVGCILGGGASNLYDRICKGAVTDYVRFLVPWRRIRRLVFNVSDFFIFLGCMLSVLLSIRRSKS